MLIVHGGKLYQRAFFIHSSSVRMFPHRLIGSLTLREMFPSECPGRRRSVGGWVAGWLGGGACSCLGTD